MSMPIDARLLEQGVKQIFLPVSKNRLVWGAAALGMSSLAITQYLSPEARKHLRSPKSWRIYRSLPSPRSLNQRKLAIRGVALVLSAFIIYATYPYLRLFLNSPFPKSFSRRLYSTTENSVILLIGTGILLGARYLISIFKIQFSLNPFRMWMSKPQNQIIPVSPSTASPSEGLGWAACPPEILAKYIFPRVMSQTISIKTFFELTAICSNWRSALLSPTCLASSNYDPHFLWVPFRYDDYDIMEIVAFFNQFLPQNYQGEGLLLPFDDLVGSLQNYITPAQLNYIVRRFPKAEIESLTLCIADDDSMPQTAELLNHFLVNGKIRKLTLACERIRTPRNKDPAGKILSGSERSKWRDLNRKWGNSPFHKNFPSQVMELLKLLKGEIQTLWFQMLPSHNIDKIDYDTSKAKKLNVVQVLTILQGTPSITSDDQTSTSPVLKVTKEIRFQPYVAKPWPGENRLNPDAEMWEVSPFIRVPKERIALPGVVETLIERKPTPPLEETKTPMVTLVCPTLLNGHCKVEQTSVATFVEERIASRKKE